MIYDITPPISPSLAVWPGDTPPSRVVLLDISRGDTVTLSTLRATAHLGAHADGPNHYGADAPAIHERRLDYYLGRCSVVRVPAMRKSRISVEMFKSASRETDLIEPRVLIATNTYPDPNHWNGDFAALAPELVDHLHERGVMTIGVDTPSVDLFDDKQLLAHKRFLANDMAILEGLRLRDVPAGVYELIALPLPLVGFDASPVRAILRTV